jgi:hypothetical protein
MMKTSKKQKRITHDDVRDALKQFVRKGGIIARLPEQKSARTEIIGSEKYETYETFSSLLSL